MRLLKLSDSNHYIYTFLSHSDEMGLGKTLQCITTLWYVCTTGEQEEVVHLSTLGPNFNVHQKVPHPHLY